MHLCFIGSFLCAAFLVDNSPLNMSSAVQSECYEVDLHEVSGGQWSKVGEILKPEFLNCRFGFLAKKKI